MLGVKIGAFSFAVGLCNPIAGLDPQPISKAILGQWVLDEQRVFEEFERIENTTLDRDDRIHLRNLWYKAEANTWEISEVTITNGKYSLNYSIKAEFPSCIELEGESTRWTFSKDTQYYLTDLQCSDDHTKSKRWYLKPVEA